MEEIEFSRWLFEGRLRQGKNVLPDGLNQLCFFAGSSKSHCENSISFMFLESPHQVDMKNVVKASKHFFGYFNTLETHSVRYVSHCLENCKSSRKESIRIYADPTLFLDVLKFCFITEESWAISSQKCSEYLLCIKQALC